MSKHKTSKDNVSRERSSIENAPNDPSETHTPSSPSAGLWIVVSFVVVLVGVLLLGWLTR